MIIDAIEIADILDEEMPFIRFNRVVDLFYILFLIALVIRKLLYLLLDLEMVSELHAMAKLGVLVFVVCCCCCFVVFKDAGSLGSFAI